MADVEEIAALLKSRQTEDRLRAVRRIARLPEASRQSLLLQALRDRSNYVAAMAAEMLGECAGEESAHIMVARFNDCMEDGPKRDPGCHIRAHLAFAFGRLEYTPAANALRAGIRAVQIEPVGGVPFDTATQLRANCALSLAQIHAPDAVRDITPLLFDTGHNAVGARGPRLPAETRKAAARALARSADLSALIPLSIKLTFPEHEEPDVLQECMQAVLALEDTRAVELLSPWLNHADASLSAFAAVMIAQTQSPEAIGLLREAMTRLTGDALRAVVLAFSTLRNDNARAALLELAEDDRAAVRQTVAEALHGAQDAPSRKVLEKLAKDRAPFVRDTARNSLA